MLYSTHSAFLANKTKFLLSLVNYKLLNGLKWQGRAFRNIPPFHHFLGRQFKVKEFPGIFTTFDHPILLLTTLVRMVLSNDT